MEDFGFVLAIQEIQANHKKNCILEIFYIFIYIQMVIVIDKQ